MFNFFFVINIKTINLLVLVIKRTLCVLTHKIIIIQPDKITLGFYIIFKKMTRIYHTK